MKKFWKSYNNFAVKINYRMIAAAAVILFFLSIVPVVCLSYIDYANGDDFGYGAVTHQIWVQTGSLWQMFKAAFHQIRNYYAGWQGTWFSLLLFQFHPAVFNERAYILVPFISLLLIIGSTSLLCYNCIVKILKLPKSMFFIADSIILFLSIQYIPRTTSSIFWYNGIAHYIIPHAMALLTVYLFLRFIYDKKPGNYITGSILMILLGGGNYQTALFIAIITVAVIICNYRKKHVFLLAIPLMGEAVGLFVSMAAPGNKVRGGNEFGFTAGKAFETVIQSLKSGAVTIIQYIKEKPMVFIMLFILFLFAWEIMSRQKIRFEFKYPLLFVLFMYGTYSAMFAPVIYAAVDVSGGPPNTIFMVFLITTAAGILYVTGWFSQLFASKAVKECCDGGEAGEKLVQGSRFIAYVRMPALLLCLILIVLFKGNIYKTSTAFYCIDFVTTGKAADYKEQMDERLAVLNDDTVKDVVLPEMNSDQYPFMHMALMKDPTSWTNTVTAQYYKKNSITAIPRKEYVALMKDNNQEIQK